MLFVQVMEGSDTASFTCECQKSDDVQTYGKGISIPQLNSIDFKNVFSNFLSLVQGNPVVLATVFGLLTIYVLLGIWVRKRDKKAAEKVLVVNVQQ